MTTIQINLPDALVQRARSEGLLSDDAIQRLLEEAMRRQAGRKLIAVAERLHGAKIAPMTDEEIVAEVEADRAERDGPNDKPPRGSQ